MDIVGLVIPITIVVLIWLSLAIAVALLLGAVIARRDAPSPEQLDNDRVAPQLFDTK
jgi:hypothetical protein